MSTNPPTFIETQPASAVAFNFKPHKDIITSLLLINITNKPVLYKLRTTAPTCYVVKPNFGLLLPSQIIDVSITMQASDFDPKVSFKNDRFQVNAILCPEGIDPNYIIANSTEFQHVWDLIPKGQRQAKNLSVEFLLESGENVGSGKRENIVTTQGQGNTRIGDHSSMSDDSASLRNETNASFFSVNTSTLATAAKKDLSGINVEKKKPEDDFYKQKITFLQKNIDKLTAENQMLKIKNQDIVEKSIKQEKLVQELAEEKQAFMMELTTLKNTTFKKRNAKEKIKESLMAGFELWHILSICIIGLILGRILMSFAN